MPTRRLLKYRLLREWLNYLRELPAYLPLAVVTVVEKLCRLFHVDYFAGVEQVVNKWSCGIIISLIFDGILNDQNYS
jgi:hypothetical protein